jgi:hypothetical protein
VPVQFHRGVLLRALRPQNNDAQSVGDGPSGSRYSKIARALGLPTFERSQVSTAASSIRSRTSMLPSVAALGVNSEVTQTNQHAAVDTPEIDRPEANSKARLSEMPKEILEKIALLVDGQSRINMAIADCRKIEPAIKDTFASAMVANHALQISTSTGFQALLGNVTLGAPTVGTVLGLRRDLQAEPLEAAGLQIHALPADDRPQEAARFRSVISAMDPSNKTAELVELGRIASFENAGKAAEAGEYIPTVAAFFGITRPQQINVLEQAAVYSAVAGDALRRGDDVQDVANRLGIMQPGNIQKLEVMKQLAGEASNIGL